MTIHHRGKCLSCKNLTCLVPCTTKWNKRQPYLVMQGFAKEVIVNYDGDGTII